MNHIKIFVSYILNCCTKKKKNSIYARIMANSKYDKYDVLNCNSSNLLRLINNLAEKKQEKDLTIYLEYFDDNRLESYLRFAKEVERNNVKLIMLKGFSKDGHLLSRYYNRLYNAFKRFSSILWLSETGDTRFDGKLKCQTEICLNYFISCKNDYIIGKDRRWEKLDVLITTALLPSHIISSTEGNFIARRRHIDAIEKADMHIDQSIYQLEEFNAAELVAEELKMAQENLNLITGKFTSDDLLGKIFSSFCIGK